MIVVFGCCFGCLAGDFGFWVAGVCWVLLVLVVLILGLWADLTMVLVTVGCRVWVWVWGLVLWVIYWLF